MATDCLFENIYLNGFCLSPTSVSSYGLVLARNLAKGLKVFGAGRSEEALTDDRLDTIFRPRNSYFPFFYVNLGAVYRLNLLRIFAPNDSNLLRPSVNFAVYTWDRYSPPCDLEHHFPWRPCQVRIILQYENQAIDMQCPGNASNALYIIFARGNPSNNEEKEGPAIAELVVEGGKMRDILIPPDFKDDMIPPNLYQTTRAVLLKGAESVKTELTSFQLLPNNAKRDVPIIWIYKAVTCLAMIRKRSRLIILSNPGLYDHIQENADNPSEWSPLRRNIIQWLKNGKYSSQKIVPISANPGPYDIRLIKSTDKVGLNIVCRDIWSNQRQVIIAMMHRRQGADLVEFYIFLKCLLIRYKWYEGKQYRYVINGSELIHNRAHIPMQYAWERYAKSWKLMHSEIFPYPLHNIFESIKPMIEETEAQKTLHKLIDRYYLWFAHHSPCDVKPVNLKYQEELKIAYVNFNMFLMAQVGLKSKAAPAVIRHPGAVASGTNPSDVKVVIKNDGVERSFIPLGSYAKAGQQFRWKLVKSSNATLTDELALQIGCQTDDLRQLETWYRWPRISQSIHLDIEGTLSPPFGGVIYLMNVLPSVEIVLHLYGIYRYPWVDIRDPETLRRWNHEKQRHWGVPMTHVSGDAMHSCLPTKNLVGMTENDLSYTIQHYDNAVKVVHNYQGSTYETAPFELFATDIALSKGWGHSGYPFMGHLPWVHFYSRAAIIDGKTFAMIHEVGHNLQPKYATLRDGMEVTNNVFYPIVQHVIAKLNASCATGSCILLSEERVRRMVNQWKAEGDFSGVTDAYYGYLAWLFGDGLVGNVWTKMSTLPGVDTPESRENIWLVELSKEAGYDLIPFHQLWRYPTNKWMKQQVAQLPCYIPKDVLTDQASEVVDRILKSTDKVCSRLKPPREVRLKNNILRGVNRVRPKLVSFV